MSKTVPNLLCWYKDRDKPSNWTAKLTIIERQSYNLQSYLFVQQSLNRHRLKRFDLRIFFWCQWYVCLLILLLFFFPAASITIMRRRRREKSRRTYKNYLFEIKKIKFKYSGFSFLPATKKTSRINLNISLHFYFLLRRGNRRRMEHKNK